MGREEGSGWGTHVAREFPGGLLKLDPAFAYAEPPSS